MPEITYTMIGGDGGQYGPVSLEQVKGWIGEGRITGETKIRRSDTNSWLPAAQYPELGATAAAPPIPVSITAPPPLAQPRPTTMTMAGAILQRRVKRGANWFYWIAALSIVNTLLAYSGAGIQFVVGLGGSRSIHQFAYENGWTTVTALILSCVAAGIFAVFGFFAGLRQNWSFIVGMILYAGDAYLCVPTQQWLALGFHGYVLYHIFLGFQANCQLNRAT